MEIVNQRQSRNYGFTLRRTSRPKDVTAMDYLDWLQSKFTNQGCKFTLPVYFEYEGGMHIHGVVDIPIKFNLKKFRVRGWNLKLEEIYDAQGWYIYCTKHEPTETDPLSEDEIEISKLPKLFKPQSKKPICKRSINPESDFCDDHCEDIHEISDKNYILTAEQSKKHMLLVTSID